MTQAGLKALSLSSPVFTDDDFIPEKYSCDGSNINPPLDIAGIPPDTKSLALIMDDPDVPGGNYVHWVMWNIPPTTVRIQENSAPGKEGKNSAMTNGYEGPCPPHATHHYRFKIYALDIELDLRDNSGETELEEAIQGHVLAQGEIKVKYQRK